MNAKQHGFTLIELMIATAITGILASIAYPSFQGPLFKARRTDGIAALMQLQLSQEHWRANHAQYASLGELRSATTSGLHYYQLSVSDATGSGFTAIATGTGAQAGDKACHVLRLSVVGGQTNFESGADATHSNASAENQRCWNL